MKRFEEANKRKERGDQLLQRALDAWREEPESGGTLGGDARERILVSALQPGRKPSHLPALFTPRRWLAAAGVLPFILAAGLLAVLGPGNGQESAPTVRATKQGDKVVFIIANGKSSHYVYKSTSPDSFDPSAGVRVTGGEYEDRVEEGASLVFYRID
jgi:hypothetical protein